MALAWKAGWVHALTSSNLVSSAASLPFGLSGGGHFHLSSLHSVRDHREIVLQVFGQRHSLTPQGRWLCPAVKSGYISPKINQNGAKVTTE